MRTATVLTLTALTGVQAFAPSPFMGSAVTSKAAVSDSKIQMVFGLGGAKKGGKGSSVKAGGKAVPKTEGPDYLRSVSAGSGPQGEWFVRSDPSLSTALPWVTKPEIGDGTLVGDFGFDPLGLSKIFDVNWLRSAELKNGRTAMLAALGLVTPELVQKPAGFEGFHFPAEFSTLNGISALGSVPKFGLAQIVLVCGIAELASFGRLYNERFTFEDNLTPLERAKVQAGKFNDLSGAAKTQGAAGVNAFGEAVDVGFTDPDKIVPGDLGFDPLGFSDKGLNPDYALSEIKHARLAMIGVAGMLAQASLEQDKGIIEQTVAWAAGQS